VFPKERKRKGIRQQRKSQEGNQALGWTHLLLLRWQRRKNVVHLARKMTRGKVQLWSCGDGSFFVDVATEKSSSHPRYRTTCCAVLGMRFLAVLSAALVCALVPQVWAGVGDASISATDGSIYLQVMNKHHGALLRLDCSASRSPAHPESLFPTILRSPPSLIAPMFCVWGFFCLQLFACFVCLFVSSVHPSFFSSPLRLACS
jgi:hypothetical protein